MARSTSVGCCDVPILRRRAEGWDFDVATAHERSASLSATAAISSDGYAILSRSAALSATAAIVSSVRSSHQEPLGCAYGHGFDRNSPQRRLHRQAALSATASIALSAQFFSILSRSAALSATAAIAASPQRALLRSAALSATGSITSTAVFFSILERQGALTALATLTAAGQQRVHIRSVSVNASADINAAGQVKGGAVTHRASRFRLRLRIAGHGATRLLHSASFGASTTIQAAPQRALSPGFAHRHGLVRATGEIAGAVNVRPRLRPRPAYPRARDAP